MPRGMGSEQFGPGGQCGCGSRQESCKDGLQPMVKQQAAEGQAASLRIHPPGLPSVDMNGMNKGLISNPAATSKVRPGSPQRGGMTSAVDRESDIGKRLLQANKETGEFRRCPIIGKTVVPGALVLRSGIPGSWGSLMVRLPGWSSPAAWPHSLPRLRSRSSSLWPPA